VLFSEPKIPQLDFRRYSILPTDVVSVLFSEPKIPQLWYSRDVINNHTQFQCSSASRKFLNEEAAKEYRFVLKSFSALQRAENSSTLRTWYARRRRRRVSVLFSEPKIPQLNVALDVQAPPYPFQCSSASRKFLNVEFLARGALGHRFQCSSASRKFLNVRPVGRRRARSAFQCSSASRKFLNRTAAASTQHRSAFQCSSASRKFLNCVGLCEAYA